MEEEYVKLVMLRNKPFVRETFNNTVSELDDSKSMSPPQRWSFSQRYLYELDVVNRVEKINLAPSCGWWHPSICFAVLKLTLLNRWNYSKQYDILLSCVSNKGRFHEKSSCSFLFCPNEGGGWPYPNFLSTFHKLYILGQFADGEGGGDPCPIFLAH